MSKKNPETEITIELDPIELRLGYLLLESENMVEASDVVAHELASKRADTILDELRNLGWPPIPPNVELGSE